jgi:hypothetical protein
MKIIANISVELNKPTVLGTDVQAVLDWIKTNVTDKLPASASSTFGITVTS